MNVGLSIVIFHIFCVFLGRLSIYGVLFEPLRSYRMNKLPFAARQILFPLKLFVSLRELFQSILLLAVKYTRKPL